MKSALINYVAVIAISGFVSACSSTPKSVEPAFGAAKNATSNLVNTVRGPSLTLDGVLFDFERASLRPSADSIVDEAADYLNANPRHNAVIEGHTDNLGASAYNQTLSTRRSDAIKDALVERGISSNRITSVGLGETQPVADNDTRSGRQSNRRVEIIFKK